MDETIRQLVRDRAGNRYAYYLLPHRYAVVACFRGALHAIFSRSRWLNRALVFHLILHRMQPCIRVFAGEEQKDSKRGYIEGNLGDEAVERPEFNHVRIKWKIPTDWYSPGKA